ncbi:hypothetical protein AB0H76_33580 [Nocardia sp. NPDC050712]|uniref:hypothetical protein n=1 Tax=Nocardia sp. NPDC050712 TaxID=3155518 RepID=UPI0033F3BF83
MKAHRLALLVAAGALALAGCTNTPAAPDGPVGPATPSQPKITMTFDSPTKSSEIPNADQITPEAANQLCEMFRDEVGDWQSQGSVLARVAYNGTVHNWGARNGGLNDLIVRDRTVVDTATIGACPETRDQVLAALDIPDLASGLAGF